MTRKLALQRPARRIAAAFFGALMLAACGTTSEEEYVERPVEQIYNEAMDALSRGNYRRAATQFEEVERQHPYSVWATKAQLMAAYAYYEDNEYDEAVIALDRFIQLHPGNRDAPYAYYLRALSYYEQITDVARDQSVTMEAMEALQEVTRRFPDSSYAQDARLKIDMTRDHLAGKEMDVGRFYQRRGQHLAAINRFRRVIEEYQTTTHVPEALHRLTESYLALGLVDEARQTASVLGYNFPGSEWYIDSYALLTGDDSLRPQENRGWLGRTLGRIF